MLCKQFLCFNFQSRLMQTIGVARGFGDHDLRLYDSNIFMKPFLSAYPEVRAKNFFYPISYKSLKFLIISPYNLEKFLQKKKLLSFSFRKLFFCTSLITISWVKSYWYFLQLLWEAYQSINQSIVQDWLYFDSNPIFDLRIYLCMWH